MTQPEQPSGGEILRAIGRVEKTMDGITLQVSKLDDKLGNHGEAIVGHGERLATVERDVRDIRVAKANEKTGNTNVRAAVIGGIISALVGGGFVVIQIITHH